MVERIWRAPFFFVRFISCWTVTKYMKSETCVRWRLIRQKNLFRSCRVLNEVYLRGKTKKKTAKANWKQETETIRVIFFCIFIFVDKRWLTRKLCWHIGASPLIYEVRWLRLRRNRNSSKRNASIRNIWIWNAKKPWSVTWLTRNMAELKCRAILWCFCEQFPSENQVNSFINRILTFRQHVKSVAASI